MSQQVEFLVDGPAVAAVTIMLAHGAGAGMDTPFMSFFAERLATNDLRVLRFEFRCMAIPRKRANNERPTASRCFARPGWW